MTTPPERRILLINPNTSQATTDRLRQVLQAQCPTGVRLDVRTARFGASYIACEASHAVAAHACLDAWATDRVEQPGPVAGVLIGCFGDPGLFALREASASPVTGLAEASFILAARRGPFAIVTGGERWKPMLLRLAQSLGQAHLLRHIETVAPSGAQLLADPVMAMECLTRACEQAAKAEVQTLILGGAGLAGYARGLQAAVSLPVIDSASAGLSVLLDGLAPAPTRSRDGFWAQWNHLPDSFSGIGSGSP